MNMRSDGYKTKIGQIIINCLELNKEKVVSVQDILSFIEENGEKTNITTVYRRLDKLIEEKKVISHSSEDGKKSLFQYIASDIDCTNHLHIQCTSCSKIFHLNCDDGKEFIEHIQKEHGIEIDLSKTILYGLCSNCKKNQ